jgi:hypothetical protein
MGALVSASIQKAIVQIDDSSVPRKQLTRVFAKSQALVQHSHQTAHARVQRQHVTPAIPRTRMPMHDA